MIKLNYPVKNLRWGSNDLNFETWGEYWKTLGYLSNPNIHRQNNSAGNINIMYENNELDNAFTGTTRIYYYGNQAKFSEEFPSLYKITTSSFGSEKFRINRKEFGETLMCDLGFKKVDLGRRDDIILPPTEEEILEKISELDVFDQDAWDEGYSLGNL